jgi:rod shape determining protein RodA
MLAICAIGIYTIKSATGSYSLSVTQGMWLAISCVVGIVVLMVDYTTIGSYYKVLYIFSVALLVLVLLIGSVRNNAKSWLGIGGIGAQPSEVAKVVIIVTLAKMMEDMDDINSWKNIAKLGVVALIPMILIELQPDTGTNIIFVVTIFAMLFIGGLNSKVVWGTVGTVATAVIGAFIIIEQGLDKYLTFLEEYQWNRIRVFFHPETDIMAAGMDAYYAKLAIGSGMFYGRGLDQTDLVNGNFISESHTDFIFSVFAEEWGFLGCGILLLLYLNIIIRSIKIARSSNDKFGYYMIIGIISMLTFQILQNIGMDIGLMPITGIPLPFVSYGGSSMLTNIISIALILNVGIRRQKLKFSRS